MCVCVCITSTHADSGGNMCTVRAEGSTSVLGSLLSTPVHATKKLLPTALQLTFPSGSGSDVSGFSGGINPTCTQISAWGTRMTDSSGVRSVHLRLYRWENVVLRVAVTSLTIIHQQVEDSLPHGDPPRQSRPPCRMVASHSHYTHQRVTQPWRPS